MSMVNEKKGLQWTRPEDEAQYAECVHAIIALLQGEGRKNPQFQQAAILNVLAQVTAWILAGSYKQQKNIDACLFGFNGAIEVYLSQWHAIFAKRMQEAQDGQA